MKKILNITLKTLLPLILGVLILSMIYADFDFSQLWSSLKEIDLFWFALSTVFGIMSHVIRGWRWRLTLEPLGFKPTNSTSIYSIFVAYAANLVVPRVGEVSRCVVLEQYDKVPFAQSLGTLVTERLIDTLMVVLITLAAVSMQWTMFTRFIGEAGLSAPTDGATGSTGGWAIIALSTLAILALLFFGMRKMAFWGKIRSFATRFTAGLLSLRQMHNKWLFIVETLGIWFCYFLQF